MATSATARHFRSHCGHGFVACFHPCKFTEGRQTVYEPLLNLTVRKFREGYTLQTHQQLGEQTKKRVRSTELCEGFGENSVAGPEVLDAFG